MPTYEYACKKCGDTIEIFQSFSDKPLKKHAHCGGELKTVFHARGIVFKGGGFYATDSKPKKADAGGDSSSDSGAKTDKAKKSEPAKTSSAASTDSD